jgi:prepilin signal peptidase PulO-like enzyme (type II secretory pathway)
MPSTEPWWPLFPGVETALIAAAFAWGATLGRFLNVVVYRVPRGTSVAGGGSRYPQCNAAIRPRDNIPIVGWLLLRGRCRDCGLAISSRYPVVEATCGVLAALVAVAELGGGRLSRLAAGPAGADRLLLHGDWTMVTAWALHTAVLLAVLTWSLLAFDGMGRPCHRAAIAMAVTVVLVTAMPELGPVGVWPDGSAWPPAQPRVAALTAALLGASAGLTFGGLTGRPADPCSLALVGAACGWQPAAAMAAVVALLRQGARAADDGGRPPPIDAGIMVFAATVQVVCWKPITAAVGSAWRAMTAS